MNQIEIEDIKLWFGDLLLENRMLQKELNRLKAELEELKRGLLSRPPKKRKETETEIMNNE
jgi:regulator of replication initiation timing